MSVFLLKDLSNCLIFVSQPGVPWEENKCLYSLSRAPSLSEEPIDQGERKLFVLSLCNSACRTLDLFCRKGWRMKEVQKDRELQSASDLVPQIGTGWCLPITLFFFQSKRWGCYLPC